jgi:hypothetical protein
MLDSRENLRGKSREKLFGVVPDDVPVTQWSEKHAACRPRKLDSYEWRVVAEGT